MKRQNTFRTEIITKNDVVSFEEAGGVRRPLMKDRDRPPENEQKLKKMKSEQEEEAENRGKSLKEELDRKNKEIETKRDDLLQLQEKEERTENKLKALKEELERQETEVYFFYI
ncbi:myb-like protein X [Mugil cephalus]|uniref:myb-like protein X n=1 Tax=Mugil cephalus TaxID=48193 RepID=UPI001FB85FA9|nr:myb-like protein X [Mugil cephalus]